MGRDVDTAPNYATDATPAVEASTEAYGPRVSHRYLYHFGFGVTPYTYVSGWTFGETEEIAAAKARVDAPRDNIGLSVAQRAAILDPATPVYLQHCSACTCIPAGEKRW